VRVLPLLCAAVLLLSGCAFPGLGSGDRTAPGERAKDYLKSQPYTSILVELHYVDGDAPDDSALSLLEQRLQDATGKSVQVAKSGGVPGQGAGHRYTFQEVADLEAKVRQHSTGGSQAVLFMLYLDGGSDQDQSSQTVLAAAYRGSSVVVFKKNIEDASCGSSCVSLPGGIGNTKPTPTAIEESVVTHETGHILGLVDCGTAMVQPHEDSQHKCHSSNSGSVMYWAVETSQIGALLGQTPPNDYDSNDKADLQAAR
jgi:hypothetical protein